MSSHTKLRKTFHLVAGAYAQVTVELHMVDPLDSEKIIDKIFLAADAETTAYRQLFEAREKARLAPPPPVVKEEAIVDDTPFIYKEEVEEVEKLKLKGKKS